MLKTTQDNNCIRGFKVKSRADSTIEIFHLRYADDALMFCEVDNEQLKVLKVIFILFEATSVLQINWNESFIYLVNEVTKIHFLVGILEGKIGELPTVIWGCHGGQEQF